jgi:hypothetical protein
MRKIVKSSTAFTTLALFILLGYTSCTKDNDPQPESTYPIEGLWIGTYIVDGYPNLGQQYYSFVIKPDGTIINDSKGENKQHIALGTWSLSGNAFSSSFTCVYGFPVSIGIKQTITAIFDDTGKLSGTWSNVAPAVVSSGTFTLSRVNK